MSSSTENQKLSAEEKARRKNEKKQRKLAQKKEQKQQRKNETAEAKKPVALFQEIGELLSEQLQGADRMAADSFDLIDRLRAAKVDAEVVATTTTTLAPITTCDRGSFSIKRKPLSRSLNSQSDLFYHSDNSTELASSRKSSDTDNTTNRIMKSKYRTAGLIFTLEDFAAIQALESLFLRYGRVSHMGILDKSYSFFINKAHTAALYFKVQKGIAVVAGDPVCSPQLFSSLLDEFKEYRKSFGWKLAFMGASDTFIAYAREKKWATIQFGTERVLNPLTNPILLEQSGKRIIAQNKQLLNPKKGGIRLGVYIPSQGENPMLQDELVGIYNTWREERNTSGTTQAFITVYDPFSLPQLMTYIYTRGSDGFANGFAALRKMGANNGYHIDPCIAVPGAPKGISDLLVFTAMALLNQAGIDYLSFGFEPCNELGIITGLSKPMEKITRKIYGYTFPRLPITGKKAYHDKFHPDENQGSGLHIIFPSGSPALKDMIAMAHMANVSIRKLIFSDVKGRIFK